MHELVEQLTSLVEQKRLAGHATEPEILDAFWLEVATLGTPLMRGDVDGRTYATFLFHESIDHMISEHAYTGVRVSWHDGPLHRLELLPRTNIWCAEIELPENFTGMYAFNCSDGDGVINEDVHEPWAMTFADQYSRPGRTTHGPDEAYTAHVVTTKPNIDAPQGAVSVLNVSADLLPLPIRKVHKDGVAVVVPHPETFPVWCYAPANLPAKPLPVVLLLAGQFLESLDFALALDRSIELGDMPPAVVVAPGDFRNGHKAWGWRHGYGPDELSGFFSQSVLPLVEEHFSIDDAVYLVAWDYTTSSAIETARRMQGVSSIILLDPSIDGVNGSIRGITYGAASRAPVRVNSAHRWSFGKALRELAATRPNLTITLGRPPQRTGDFSWKYYRGEEARAAIVESGLMLVEFEVTDGNIVAAAEALGAGVGAALLQSLRGDSN